MYLGKERMVPLLFIMPMKPLIKQKEKGDYIAV